MNYYVVSPNIYNDGDNYAEEMYTKGIAAVGWDLNNKNGMLFKSIQTGDCIIVAKRTDWKWKYFYMGLVVGEEKTPSCGTLSKKLSPIINLENHCGLDFDIWSVNGSKQIQSPQRIDEYKGDNSIIIKQINNYFNMEQNITLLTRNHNLILTGAPGTGKTYLAQQIARELGCTADRIGFVQFHPSYDYTDFVEGIRPIQDGGKDVGFKPKDGVFKQFCEKALTAYLNADNEADAPKFVFIIDEINRGDISKIFGELFFSIDPGYRVTKDMLDNHKSGKALLMTVKTQYANMQEKCPNAFDEALGIDDVNDCGHFFVPENVYIIGTMNDIDRSVESMDFAFRRRFAFKEIKADKNIGMLDGMDNREKIINRMNNLNCEIEKIEGLSPAYHIGGSYFMKLKDYQKEDKSYDYEELWNNHIVGLLWEYLRNQPEAKDKIIKLKEEFDNEEPHTENNQE